MHPAEITEEARRPSESALIDLFEQSLDELKSGSVGAEAALRVLLLRDRIACSMKAARPDEPAIIQRLSQLDQRLKGVSAGIRDSLSGSELAGWRATVLPDAGAWWWNPDIPGNTHSFVRFFAPFLNILAVSVLVALVADLLRRFLAETPDDVGLWYLGCQSALAILTGAAFTDAGGRWLEGVIRRGRFSGLRLPLLKTTLLLAALASVAILRFRLDVIALHYQNRGAARVAASFLGGPSEPNAQTTAGIQDLRRALAISPQLPVAHYSLGFAYDALGDYDKALAEYRIAMIAPETFVPACNNAARILIRKKDYAGALQLLFLARATGGLTGQIGSAVWKNLGFAHLRLNQLMQARQELKQALALNSNGAEAHCLMAELLDRADDPGAKEQRSQCLLMAAATPTTDADLWSAAQEKDLEK